MKISANDIEATDGLRFDSDHKAAICDLAVKLARPKKRLEQMIKRYRGPTESRAWEYNQMMKDFCQNEKTTNN